MLNGAISPTSTAVGPSVLCIEQFWAAAGGLLAPVAGGDSRPSPDSSRHPLVRPLERDLASMPAARLLCSASDGSSGSSNTGSPGGLGGGGSGDGGGGGGDGKDKKGIGRGAVIAATTKKDETSETEGRKPMRNNFYDDPTFFTSYTTMRRETHSANDHIEKPYLKKLLPDLAGKRVLELGCGMGQYVLDFMAEAEHVDAVDISENMLAKLIDEVQRRSLENVNVIKSSIEDFDFRSDSYDVVISTLAFHYVADLDAVFKAISRSLRKGGTFVFNVEHPVYTSAQDAGWETTKDGSYSHWRLDNYFETGLRKAFWHDIEVEKFHRTTEDYFELLINNGFSVTRLMEPKPSAEARELDRELDRHHRRPPFLMFAAVKE